MDAALIAINQSDTAITSIKLNYNHIDYEGAKHIAVALEKNSTLTSIDLNDNKMGKAGAKVLAAAITKNQTLLSIKLCHNVFGAEGANALAAALEKNSTLTSIDLSINQIGDEGIKDLAAAIAMNKALIRIVLSINGIGAEGAKHIAAALEKNSTLTSIRLMRNIIGDEGAKVLATAIERNQTLTSIDLFGNGIGDEGAKALAAALEKNQTLTFIDLDGNNISDEVLVEIDTMVQRNIKNTYQKTLDMVSQKENPQQVFAALKTARALAEQKNNKEYIRIFNEHIEVYEVLATLENLGIHNIRQWKCILESLTIPGNVETITQQFASMHSTNLIKRAIKQAIRVQPTSLSEFMETIKKCYVQLSHSKSKYAKEAMADLDEDVAVTRLVLLSGTLSAFKPKPGEATQNHSHCNPVKPT
ncbi:MAG: hypothetical protein ACHQAX_06135 [Gammaproteobacteria bacterium]